MYHMRSPKICLAIRPVCGQNTHRTAGAYSALANRYSTRFSPFVLFLRTDPCIHSRSNFTRHGGSGAVGQPLTCGSPSSGRISSTEARRRFASRRRRCRASANASIIDPKWLSTFRRPRYGTVLSAAHTSAA